MHLMLYLSIEILCIAQVRAAPCFNYVETNTTQGINCDFKPQPGSKGTAAQRISGKKLKN